MTAGIKNFLTLLVALLWVNGACAQTYNQMTWGFTLPSGSPYSFGANIQGNWYNLGMVSSAGAWTLSPTSFRQPNSTLYAASLSKPAGIQRSFSTWYTSQAALVAAGPQVTVSPTLTVTDNGIIGATYQNQSSVLTFPTGVTGYALMDTGGTGNTAFGGFFRCDAYTTGVCVGAEFDTFNYSGNANATFPPTTGPFPIASNEHNGVQIVNFGSYISKIGLYLTSTTGGYGYQAGIYGNPISSNAYGIFMDANTVVGPATAAQFNTTGGAATTNLKMQMQNAPNATARFISALNSAGTTVFQIDGFGNTVSNGYVATPTILAQNSTFPIVRFSATTNALDEKLWDSYVDAAGTYVFRALNDAQNTSSNAMSFTRTGVSVTGATIVPPTTFSSAVTVQSVRPTPSAFASLAACAVGNAGTIDVISDGATYAGGATGTAASGGGTSYRVVLCTNARAGTYEWDYN